MDTVRPNPPRTSEEIKKLFYQFNSKKKAETYLEDSSIFWQGVQTLLGSY